VEKSSAILNFKMSMIPEITPDQIDDWFKIGKKTSKIKTVPKSFTGGRAIDPITLQPKQPQHHHIPHYKRFSVINNDIV
jgi:hypothetical protein